MQAQQPVIRTYKGRDRRAAEDAYRVDADGAARAGWYPVAHRWTSAWDGHELAVVFELRTASAPLGPALGGSAAAPGTGQASMGSLGMTQPGTGQPGMGSLGVAQPGIGQPVMGSLGVARPGMGQPGVAPPGMARPDIGAPPAPSVASPAFGPSGIAPPVARGLVTPPAMAPAQRAAAPLSAARAHTRATLQTIDLHCAGEPLRLVRSGFPEVPVAPILERRRWVRDHADHARRALMYEPRGHRDMYGAVLMSPHRPDADIAVLFMHNEGYSTMCGHGTIAIGTALIEEGLYPATEPQTTIRLETPAGVVAAVANVTRGRHGGPEVSSVRFTNVPAYVAATDVAIRIEDLGLAAADTQSGTLNVALAFGGAYYGIADAANLGLRVVPGQVEALTKAGAAITEILRRDHTPTHPTQPDLGFVYGTIIVDYDPGTSPDGKAAGAYMRNVAIFAESEVDRSPCGSGTSALLAYLFARGGIQVGQDVVNAGITGEAFRGRVEGRTVLGDRDAVITSVEGSAYVTGYNTFVIDDRDPLAGGFLLR
jgi:proline racemase